VSTFVIYFRVRREKRRKTVG